MKKIKLIDCSGIFEVLLNEFSNYVGYLLLQSFRGTKYPTIVKISLDNHAGGQGCPGMERSKLCFSFSFSIGREIEAAFPFSESQRTFIELPPWVEHSATFYFSFIY